MPSSRGLKAGKAFIEFSLSDKKFRKQLQNLQRRLTAVGSAMQKIGRGALAGGAAIAGAFVYPIKAASDLEETMNKFNVVFGSSAGEVKTWGDDFAGVVGRSKKQIADMMAGAQDLFVPLGFTSQRATELSKQITGLSLDLASFNNMVDADTMRDLQAALTGSGEVMKKYGVVLSEAAVKQELLNQGLDPKTATNHEKVQARLNIIMRGTTAAQGDAIRSAGGFANQMKALAGSASDLAAEIGGAVLPYVTMFVSQAREALSWVTQWASQNKGLIVGVAGLGVALVAIGGILTTAGIAASILATAVGGIATVLGVVLSPIGLVVAGITGLVAWFATATETGQQMVADLVGSFGWLKDLATESFGAISAALQNGDIEGAAAVLWGSLKVIWLEGVAALQGAWDGFWGGLTIIGIKAFGMVERAWSHFTDVLKMMWGNAKEFIMLGLLNLVDVFTSLIQLIPGIGDTLSDTIAGMKADLQAEVADNAAAINAEGEKDREKSRKLEEGAIASVAIQGDSDALIAAKQELAAQKELLAQKQKQVLIANKPVFGPENKAADAATAGIETASAATNTAKSAGTFSGMAAMFGGVDLQDEQLRVQRRIEKNTRGGGLAIT